MFDLSVWSRRLRGPTVGLAMLSVTSCGGGGSVSDGTGPDPTPPTDTTKPPTTVQRAAITVRVTIDPGDATIATTAGVGSSGVTVRITRTTPGVQPQTATTGSDGSVRFDNLLEGVYQVSVDRPLTSSELAQLAPAVRRVLQQCRHHGVSRRHVVCHVGGHYVRL